MKKIFLLAFSVLLSGCASQELKPGMISIYTSPNINFEKDPDATFDKYNKFYLSPFPDVETNENFGMSPIAYKQLLFLVRNKLELLGYMHADTIQNADFWVSVFYSNEYKSQYVPPSSSTVPWYVPGQTQTSNVNLYGSSGYSWGTATTTTPGYYVPMTVTRPGYHTGSYYPYVNITACDKLTNKPTWSGTAIVATPEEDIRRSGQVLIRMILLGEEKGNFPPCNQPYKKDDSLDGCFGIGFMIITLDGNNFYPLINAIWCDSPAYQQKLKIYDIIIKIDGHSTLNWPRSKIIESLNKNRGEDVVLSIKRQGKTFEINLVAEDEAIAKKNWKKIKTTNEKGNVITKKMQIE